MVTTRGTDQDVVAFVTGQEKIDPAFIQAEQWVPILRAAIKELPVNYLRGLKSVRQILKYDGTFGVERVVNSPLPLLWRARDGEVVWNQIRPNEVFLECAETGGGFPQGKYVFETYPTAPRKPLDQEGDDESLASISTGHYLLARDRTLYYLTVSWLPKAQWDEQSMSSTPVRFWYEVDPLSVALEEVDDRKLTTMLAAAHKRTIPQVMLQRFNMALIETANDARGQYDHILQKKQTISGYLDRIGQLVS